MGDSESTAAGMIRQIVAANNCNDVRQLLLLAPIIQRDPTAILQLVAQEKHVANSEDNQQCVHTVFLKLFKCEYPDEYKRAVIDENCPVRESIMLGAMSSGCVVLLEYIVKESLALKSEHYMTELMIQIAVTEHPDLSETASRCVHTVLFTLLKKEYPNEYNSGLQYKDSNSNQTLVHCAVESGCVLLLDFLAKEGCCLTDELKNRPDPLSLAVEWGKLKAVKYLLETRQFDIKRKETDGTSYLMRACLGLSIDAVKLLLDEKTKKFDLLEYRNTYGNCCVELIIRSSYNCDKVNGSCKHIKMLNFVRETTSDEDYQKAVHSRSKLGCSLIQEAVFSDCEELLRYLHREIGLQLDIADNDGDIALGDAASLGNMNALRYLVQNGQPSHIEHRNKKGETPFLQACRGIRHAAAKYLAEHGANVFAKDYCDNTAIHLVCSTVINNENCDSFFGMIFQIILLLTPSDKALDELKKENISRNNMMMALAESGNLFYFLRDDNANMLQIQLLISTLNRTEANKTAIFKSKADAMNILHVYSGKHCLKSLQERFQKFSDQWDELIRAQIQSGFYKGYGCLHFACQTGHLDNINYLLNKYPDCMKLYDATLSECASPMDVLLKHRHGHLLEHIESISFDQIICGVDNVLTALKLPTVEEAKTTLLPLCEPDLKGAVMRPELHKNEQYASGRSSNDGLGGVQYSYGSRLFYLALKEDSTEIFRCLVALGFWSYLRKKSAAEDFNNYICHLIDSKNKVDARIADVLPSLHKGFGHYLSWKPSAESKVCFDLPVATLLGIAIRSGRLSIARDLILLDQYNLIPTCLAVIEECQSLIADKKGLRECLEDLSSFSLNISLNALDELDKSEDVTRMERLHKYMSGRFCLVSNTQCCSSGRTVEDMEFMGPKFPSLVDSNIKTEMTILELAVQSGSKEIIASKCFKRFSKVEWAEKSFANDFEASPQTKLYIHIVFFMAFFGLLTYYVCALESETSWIDILICIFGVSFAIQELIDFIQTVKKKRLREQRRCCLNFGDYLSDIWNYVDIFGIVLLLSGNLSKLYLDATIGSKSAIVLQDYFSVRVTLSFSHVIWSFRLISFLRAFRFLGPSISMLKTLIIRDLLPFLSIFMLMSLSFGVLFLNLLFPDLRSYTQDGAVGERSMLNLLSIYTRPLLTAFGEMDMEDMANCENLNAQWLGLNETDMPRNAACTHPVGTFHFRKYLILPFLFLVNLTMLNMLIAKFSLTVSSKEDKAYMIWRRYDAGLLMDYKRSPTLPPPFTLVWLPILFFASCRIKSACSGCKNKISTSTKDMKFWWRDVTNEPDRASSESNNLLRICFHLSANDLNNQRLREDNELAEFHKYREFLFFQASTFRNKRSGFTKPRKDHGSIIEKLKVDIQRLSNRDAS